MSNETVALTLHDAGLLAHRILVAQGVSDAVAATLSDRIVAAERDGPVSHGLFMLPSYVSGLRSGWVNRAATPRVERARPGMLVADGDNGFAQPVLEQCRDALVAAARKAGVAMLSVHDVHHIASLRADVEPFAEDGLLAITCVTSRPWMSVGTCRRVLGTNPIAFAAPCAGRPPFVWDMATTGIAVTEVRAAASKGRAIPPGLGLDAAGRPTCDPSAVLDGGMLLPFGDHKGQAIAMMVEVLAAAMTGGQFAIEDRSGETPGAASHRGGQVVILIDPQASAGPGVARRIAEWLEGFTSAPGGRIPGDRRLARRRVAEGSGIRVDAELLHRLHGLMQPA